MTASFSFPFRKVGYVNADNHVAYKQRPAPRSARGGAVALLLSCAHPRKRARRIKATMSKGSKRRRADVVAEDAAIDGCGFELIDVIGEGTFSVVYRARSRMNGQLCAVKRLKRMGQAASRIRDEVGCMLALRGCEHVVRVIGCSRDESGQVDIVMP